MRIILGAITIFFLLLNTLSANTIMVNFYGENIVISYEDDLVARYDKELSNEADFVKFYKLLEIRAHESYLKSLQKAKKRYRLNDWLYYKLVEKSLDEICQSRSDRFQGVLSWFIMSKSGYDARATYTRSEFYVNVSTNESVFESPMYEVKGESFANLSAIIMKGRMINMVYAVEYTPNNAGKNFSFAFDEHPLLTPQRKAFTYRFEYNDKVINIPSYVDKTIVDIMSDYPKFDEIYFVRSPLSEVAKESLLPVLKKEMDQMTDQEKMEFLVSFTRRGLKYGSDKRGFGDKNRPLIAEEALYYPSVDCEDKVAVLYNLVKELTQFEGVVLAMPEHLSFAVALKQPIGKTYRFKGKKYTICDPTGPENNSSIGVFPFDAELRRGEVLGEL